MNCKKCDSQILLRGMVKGIKTITCNKCGGTKGVNIVVSSGICASCSTSLKLCHYCGSPLKKEEEEL